MTAQLRHIAISVPDVAAAQAFFEQAFAMTKAGDAGRGVYMTDGVMNVALLYFGDDPVPGITQPGTDEPFLGLYHFGMWVDDLDTAAQRVEQAGATHVRGRRPDEPNRYYEVKYCSPDGLIFDLTTSGWAGAIRHPLPAPGATAAGEPSGHRADEPAVARAGEPSVHPADELAVARAGEPSGHRADEPPASTAPDSHDQTAEQTGEG